ncbi:hypothetical protein [Dactylosporangium sp. NPDC049140]|uniref:hypothetical protein n=1 Tax=Dactylosporangium sp. NPDC049140 TaxID=3155647 RepID=UPI0033E508B3
MTFPAPDDDWQRPQRPDCACREHLEDVQALVIPSEDWDEDPTFEDLLATGSLGVRPIDPKERFVPVFDEHGHESRLGPIHWQMGAADEIYGCYADDAELPLDRSIAAQPGVDLVEWYDREEFLIGAPGLCDSGLLAAIARAMHDPRVRAPR